MDLKYFYQRLREVSSEIKTEYVVIISAETPDGGKPGVSTEVSRLNAARAVVEGWARLASKEEEEEFRSQVKAQVEMAAAEFQQAQAAIHGARLSMLPRITK